MYDAFPELPALYDNVPLYVNRRDVRFYVEEARSAAGSVLEVGCGTGRILLPIARAGFSVRSIYGDFDRSKLTDRSPEQIVCAERITAVGT